MAEYFPGTLKLVAAICFLNHASCALADPTAFPPPLVIRANVDAPWGGQIADVEKVLYSAANELWKHFPQRALKPILVEPKGGPITLYERTPAGEIRVRLNTGDRLWAQHAFQFAHEFGHILCNYQPGASRNKWFEETICEVASLFALRRMSETWATTPPYPNWKSYAPSLSKYADDRMKSSQLRPGETLGDWYRAHADQLVLDAINREHNLVVATALLAMFERQPEHWEAVTYLNDDKPSESITFTVYLNNWHKRCPAKHQPFVAAIARQFEITIPVESNPARDQVQAKYDQQIEALSKQISELRKQRDAELKQLFERDQKSRSKKD